MLERLSYLNLQEAAEYCNCTEGQLLRLAERGPEYIELLYLVDYEDMGFGPDQIPMDTGDTEHFLAVPSIHAKELVHKGQTSIQTFLVSETAGWTAIMLDILQRLSIRCDQGIVKEIRCKSEWIVKKKDLYIMREPLDRLCGKREPITPTNTDYLTLEEASQHYNKSTDQILMEAIKGSDHLELLYWVSYEQIYRKKGKPVFGGVSVAGDYLVLPKERIVELRHKGVTGTDCFYYPVRSPMHESMVQIRDAERYRRGDSRGEEFIRCAGILLIYKNDKGLFVTRADLDRIWPRPVKGIAGSIGTSKKRTESDEAKYPLELQAALSVRREFSAKGEVIGARKEIIKWLKESEFDLGKVYSRVAELVTCKEVDIAVKAWDEVYGQEKESSKKDIEKYLKTVLRLSPTSAKFRRIAIATTPDKSKPHNVCRGK